MIFDVIFLIILSWAVYKGYKRGFILQAATLAALILGIFGAVKFSDSTTFFLRNTLSIDGEYMPIISFAVTFLGIVIGIHFLARISEKLLQAISLNFINRLLGIIFNLIKYAFIISVILVVLNGVNRRVPFLTEEKINESVLYKPLSLLAPLIFPYLQFDSKLPYDSPEQVMDELRI